MTLLNIFHSGGLWAVLFLPLIGAIISFRNAYKASKSGSLVRDNEFSAWKESATNIPIYKTAWFYFGCLCVIAFLLILVFMASDYKGV
jgi:hypothetical protein